MRRFSRLRFFLAVAGVCYAALIVFAVAIFQSTPIPGSSGVVPTLFTLPQIPVTSVRTMQSLSVAAVEPSRAAAPLVAFAPTNTLPPVVAGADPTQTMTPTQAAALLEAGNSLAPTNAPLWTSGQAQPDVVVAPLQSGAVPNQIVVRFQPNATDAQKQAYIDSIGGTVDQKLDPLNSVVVNVPDAARAAAADNSIVQASEPDYYLSALDDVAASNDPALVNQWALSAIQAPAAWLQLPPDAATVVVAVIDSGICASHPDLAGHLVAGWDFVDNDAVPQDELGHGCSVSGVIAAEIDNNLGIAGVAPNARVMPLRVLNAQGVGRYSDVATAILYAADHGAQIINLSLGGTDASSTLKDAIDYAVGKGLTIVAASGNTGTSGVLYPAAYSSVVAVGSVDSDLRRSSFSTYGPEVDLMAPGRNILTTTLNGDYGYVSGTSFAAPQVAGVAAIDRALGLSLPGGGRLVYAGAPSLQPDPTEEATASLAATAEATAAEAAPVDPQYAGLLDEVQRNGHIRLIVGVNAGFRPEGELSGDQQVEAQRAAIAQSQGDVISALSAYDVSITAQYEIIPYLALQADEAALRYLISSPDVTSIKEDKPVPPIAVTNTSLIGADASWTMGYQGAGQAVAVLDTGVDTSHAYLGGRVVAERCHSTSASAYGVVSLCPNGQTSQSGSGAANPSRCSGIEVCSHGTHVSGIIAGKNSSQSGVAPSAKIIAVQIFSRFNNSGDCGGAAPCLMSYESDQISGLQEVYNLRGSYSIAAINMSLGGGSYTGYCDSVEVSMKSMIDSLRSVGIATVIAAGNDGYTNAISAPGCISSAISVGATDLSDKIASWSNRASFLSLFAPGVSINSSIIGGGYAAWSGTSMATPHVAGALAVLRSYSPNASVSDLLAALKNSGKPISGSSARRIQIDAALILLGAQGVATASPTPTWTPTPTPTMTPTPADLIVKNGFESGTLSGWTSSTTDNGHLTVSTSAALIGWYGLKAAITDNNPMYVTDETPMSEKSYRARFYFDPNTITMKSGDAFVLFYGYTGTSTQVLRVEMQSASSKYQLRVSMKDDGSSWKTSGWYTITDAPHAVELYWLASTSTSAKNGSVTLWLDGAQMGSVTKIDNDTRRIDMIRLGAIEAIDSNTRGTIYFDTFESHRNSYIGLTASEAGISAPTPTPTFTPTFTPTPVNVISRDGFESGTLSGWTSSTTDNGHLTVSTSAALVGWYGLKAAISDNNPMYVTDETPGLEKSYRARFYVDPNTIKMKSGDVFVLFYGYTGTSTQVVRVEMQSSSNKYQLRAALRDDGSSWKTTSWYTISDAPHAVELYWLASTNSSTKNGSLVFWIDGTQMGSVTGVDNDTRVIDMVRLGAIESIDSNTRGTIYFDTFESHRTTYIGPTGSEGVVSAPTPTPTFTPTFTPTPSEFMFADSFESGNLSAWPTAAIDGGNLNASTAAAIVGSYGLQAVINDSKALYVTDTTPNGDRSYRARFYFDPNSIKMKSGDAFVLFYGYTGTSTQVIRLEMQSSSGNYQLRAALRDDGSGWKTTSWYTFSDAPHAIEFYWLASINSSARNGSVTLWIDGAQKGSVTGVDNDTRVIDQVQLGPIEGIDSNTRGTVYFDAFESHRTTYIGLAAGAKLTGLSADEPVIPPTFLPTATLPAAPVLPTSTEAAPTATEVVPPTATMVAPTMTLIPPTAVPPTEIPVPPTPIPPTEVPPTDVPPTDIPPTDVPVVETQLPVQDTQSSAQSESSSDNGAQSDNAPNPDDAPSDGG